MVDKKVKKTSKKLAITSLILGIVSFVFVWFPFLNLLISSSAVIIGIIAVARMQKIDNFEGQGMAIAGIIIGVVVFMMSLIFTLLGVIGIMAYFGVFDVAS